MWQRAGYVVSFWAQSANLDDCSFHHLAIGNSHFQAIDNGETLVPNEFAQQQLCGIERDERNQCALLSSDAGFVANDIRLLRTDGDPDLRMGAQR